MPDIPPALEPIYTTEKINQNIALYAGELEIKTTFNNQSLIILGRGKVTYKWFPSPKLQVEFTSQSNSSPLLMAALYDEDSQPAYLNLVNIKVFNVEIIVNQLNLSNSISISATISEPIVQGNGRSLSHILFHVTNFHGIIGRPTALLEKNGRRHLIERIVFEANGWQITLDQLETTPSIVQSLNAQGGFGITHVCRLQKLNGQTFSDTDALKFLQLFTDFLSFTRGFYICTGLLVGYGEHENKIWEHWQNSSGNSWKSIASWCPKQEGKMLSDVFPGFVKWWQSWAESAKQSLYWYLQASYDPLAEQAIVNVQIALEILTYVHFVELSGMSKAEYKKNKSIGNTRNLLTTLNIPHTIPETGVLLNKLREFVIKNDWSDGIKTINKMRNSITHPETSKRELFYNASSMTKIGAAYLSLWYLELTFLAMFGYDKLYSNRLVELNLQPVPWRNVSETEQKSVY
ncbi:hypothetical protein [Myxosarcina sp. GI1]|uniref:hypothetical protein n=1 Tax=Myxosarcina sp. GI1 TaxID=1541065 RepID=UPI000566DF93|nr:hypothetical protein [Myxosarcina sp. GI1]